MLSDMTERKEQDPGDRGTGVTLKTLGHAHDPLERFINALKDHQIGLVIDVRSRPWIKRAQHFNREALDPALDEKGIDYLWLGEHLGQRPEGDQFYDGEGYALYEPISQEPWFLKAIGRVEYEAERRRLALVCLEEEPERCHRYHLLGRVLVERGAEVEHIRRDGRIESQSEVAQRLGEAQTSLLNELNEVWRSPEPMPGGHGIPRTSDGLD
jgi:uncharacterized protein (DUF488 family)